jgi:hypothetical protein
MPDPCLHRAAGVSCSPGRVERPYSWRPGAFGLKNLVLLGPAAARDQLAALVPVIERC